MLALTILWYLLFFAGSVLTGAEASVLGVELAAGVAVFVVAGADLSIIFELLSPKLPVKLKLDNNIKAIKIKPNVQVLLSKKSVVFEHHPSFVILQ